MVQNSVRPLKILGGGVGHKLWNMEKRFASMRKSARSLYNSRTLRQTAFVVAALFIVFHAFTIVPNGGDAVDKIRSEHTSFSSAPILNQVNFQPL